MNNTPIRDEIKNRIPDSKAIEDMIVHAGNMERYLREIYEAATNDWAKWMQESSSKWIDEVEKTLKVNDEQAN